MAALSTIHIVLGRHRLLFRLFIPSRVRWGWIDGAFDDMFRSDEASWAYANNDSPESSIMPMSDGVTLSGDQDDTLNDNELLSRQQFRSLEDFHNLALQPPIWSIAWEYKVILGKGIFNSGIFSKEPGW